MLKKEQMLELLRKDVVPALACTEPVCAACAGAGMAEKSETVESVRIEVNAGIYKNGMSAGIPGCSMKVAAGSFAAVMSAMNAVNHVALRVSDGICGETPEECIEHMARIGNQGMVQTDRVILDIMTERQNRKKIRGRVL